MIVSFNEPVCSMQHAIPPDFILLSQGVPHFEEPFCEIKILQCQHPRDLKIVPVAAPAILIRRRPLLELPARTR